MALTRLQQWYYQHMGYSYPSACTGDSRAIRRHRERQARETARAVTYWQEHGTWEWDGDDMDWSKQNQPDGGHPTCGWCPPDRTGNCPGHVASFCVLKDADGNHVASLGGIVDADQNYTRVVEAELANEGYYETVTKPAATTAFVHRYFAI